MKTYRYFWQLIRYRPGYYTIDLIAMIFNLGIFTVQGWILHAYFDYLSGESQLTLANIIGGQLGYWLLVFLGILFSMIYFNHFLQHSMALMLRNLIQHILTLPGSQPLPIDEGGQMMSTGEAISTLRDDTQQLGIGVALIDDLISSMVGATAALIVMLSINPFVTIGTFAPLLVVIFIAHRLGNYAEKLRSEGRRATSNVTGLIADMFQNSEAIKTVGAEARVVDYFRKVNDARKTAMIRDTVLTQFVEALSGGASDFGIGLILLLSAQAMYNGSFTIADFALFASYVFPITKMMQIMATLVTLYRQVGVSTKRMDAMMHGLPAGAAVAHHPIYLRHDPPALDQRLPSAETPLSTITISDLTFTYPGSNNGVRNLTFSLEQGSFTVITGRIGSGKSTLLKLLLGLLPADEGTIAWNGEVVDKLDTFMVPPHTAYTAQVPTLFSDSLLDNILLGLSAETVDVNQAIHAAVLEEDVQAMDNGLETLVGSRGVRLSGGQVQRSAAARMFVRSPQLYLLDDLSSALDVNTEKLLWERLFARQQPTCLVVSHRHAALRRADQIILMENGEIAAIGRLETLLEHSAEMRRLWQADDTQSTPD